MASEVGVIDIDPAKVVTKGRLQPGKMFLIDTAEGRIVDDEEIKGTLAAEHPYAEWLEQGMAELADLPEREHVVFSHHSVLRRQQMFGYTHEELKIIVAPMALKRRRADRLDGHRHADRRVVGTAAAAVRLLPAAVRAGHEPAARRDPRGSRHRRRVGGRSGGQPPPAGPRELPPARPAVPDHRQRRAGQDHPRRRRRRIPGAQGTCRQGAVPRRRWRRRVAAVARDDLRRGVTGDRQRRPGDRAVRPQRRRDRRARSRRCCSRRRCTTTSCAPNSARWSGCSSSAATPARCTTWRC